MGDRNVVRISNAWLSQKLMQEDRLTLEKAVKEAKSSELVKEHHEILKADENGKLEGKVNGVRSKKKSQSYRITAGLDEILKSFHLSERSLTYDRMKSRFETQLWALRILF